MALPSPWSATDCVSWSEDGYVRLTFRRFCQLGFARRVTIPDEDLRSDLLAQDVPAYRAGYCDWVDTSTAVQINVAWAWFALDATSPHLLAPGGVSTNVMITTVDGCDLGPRKTSELLASWLSAQTWQQDLRRTIVAAGTEQVVSLH